MPGDVVRVRWGEPQTDRVLEVVEVTYSKHITFGWVRLVGSDLHANYGLSLREYRAVVTKAIEP